MKKLLYFCMAGGILLLSFIVVNISPAIKYGSSEWSSSSCSYYSYLYKNDEKKDLTHYFNSQEYKDKQLYEDKRDKTICERKKAMAGLEYAAFNINLVFGFVCTLLGFLFFFNIGDVGKIASFAGLGTGIVGFVLTFVYVIESGLVFNDIADTERRDMRIDSDGAFLKWNSKKNHYTCIFYKKDDYDSIYLRYSDYGNKYLNYNKDVRPEEKNYKYQHCTKSDYDYFRCKDAEEKEYPETQTDILDDQLQPKGKCDKLILNRCYIEHLTIIRSRLSEVSIYNLLDGENFNLSDSTIGEFYTNHAAVFGGFHSHKTTVGTYNLNYTTGIKPPSNDIILYKKCEGRPDKNDSSEDHDSDCDIVIVKLSVPAKAKRVYCGDLKIRVSEATVVDFYYPDGRKYELKDGWCVSSNWNKKFKYHIGATVKPEDKFNPTSGQCGSGIHGFIEFNDAVNY